MARFKTREEIIDDINNSLKSARNWHVYTGTEGSYFEGQVAALESILEEAMEMVETKEDPKPVT